MLINLLFKTDSKLKFTLHIGTAIQLAAKVNNYGQKTAKNRAIALNPNESQKINVFRCARARIHKKYVN